MKRQFNIFAFLCCAYSTYCLSMNLSVTQLCDTVGKWPKIFIAWVKNEHHLLETPALSPLPDLPCELVQKIALSLDGQSMPQFALCCKSINQKLNSSPHWAVYWHENEMRAPLKVMKDYIVYNGNFIEWLIMSTESRRKFAQDFSFSHPLADLNYFRIDSGYDYPVLYEINYSLYTSEQMVAVCKQFAERQKLSLKSMLSRIIMEANDPKCVHFLLEQRANINQLHEKIDNSISKEMDCPIIAAIIAFGSYRFFFGNIDRFNNIINILMEHNFDISKNKESPHLHVALMCDNAHLLIPILLNLGIDPNKKFLDTTPLIFLAQLSTFLLNISCNYYQKYNNLRETIQCLLEAKADPSIRDKNNKTFMQYLSVPLRDSVQCILDEMGIPCNNTTHY